MFIRSKNYSVEIRLRHHGHPCIRWKCGMYIHRMGLPAIIFEDGSVMWFEHDICLKHNNYIY